MCKETKRSCFTALGSPARIWTIPAIHGETEKLTLLHDEIYREIRPGDRIVYLGNYTGFGRDAAGCIDEILTFRRLVLSLPGMIASDIVYLRGRQEEMWQKLLQLQFAPNPTDVFLWMLGNGMAPTLVSYGISQHDGIEACRYGVMGLTKWTNVVREAVRRHKGHDIFAMHQSRAAYTDLESAYPMLFVHAGINTSKTLEDQGDSFWWGQEQFDAITIPYLPFQKVIRGYDPARRGLHTNCVTATLDDGCGFGGPLICAGFEADGNILDIIEA